MIDKVKKKIPGKREDMLGKVFGRLTVIELAEPRYTSGGNRQVQWKCLCSCGNTRLVTPTHLKNNKVRSCGCVFGKAVHSDVNTPQDFFIQQAKTIHGDVYDYSKVVYNPDQTPVEIVCNSHGSFFLRPGSHLNGTPCPKCTAETRLEKRDDLTGKLFGRLTATSPAPDRRTPGGSLKWYWNTSCSCGGTKQVNYQALKTGKIKTCGCVPSEYCDLPVNSMQELFVHRSSEIHNNKYDYSLSNYTHSKVDVKIICPVHGNFWQNPTNHALGLGCNKCAIDSRRHTQEDFVRISNETHSNYYDYTDTVYVSTNDKLSIRCPSHGVFEQLSMSHMLGNGCPKCAWEGLSNDGYWTFQTRCKENEQFASREGVFYVLELSNDVETFIKIGVSSNYKARLSDYKRDGFTIKELLLVTDTNLVVGDLEQKLLKHLRSLKKTYKPHTQFAGRTECFKLEEQEYIFKYVQEATIDRQ